MVNSNKGTWFICADDADEAHCWADKINHTLSCLAKGSDTNLVNVNHGDVNWRYASSPCKCVHRS